MIFHESSSSSSKNWHDRFTANYPKFLSNRSIRKKCDIILHPPFQRFERIPMGGLLDWALYCWVPLKKPFRRLIIFDLSQNFKFARTYSKFHSQNGSAWITLNFCFTPHSHYLQYVFPYIFFLQVCFTFDVKHIKGPRPTISLTQP